MPSTKSLFTSFRCRKKKRLPLTLCNGCSLNVLVHMNFKLFKLKPKTHLSSDTIEYEKWMTAHMLCQRVVFFQKANPWKCLKLYMFQIAAMHELHMGRFFFYFVLLSRSITFRHIQNLNMTSIWLFFRSYSLHLKCVAFENRHNGQMNRKRYTKYILENLQTQQHTERHRM